jgi:hypothetical protein
MGKNAKISRHAVLAIDPGGTTGVAAAYCTPAYGRKETIESMELSKSLEVSGTWDEQALQLAKIIERFVFTANVEQALPMENIHIAWEDFILRRRQEGGATGNLTSIWVMAATMGRVAELLADIDVKYQQPSQAKSLATNERIKRWGLWVVGSEHERDAWRHWVLRVDSLIV